MKILNILIFNFIIYKNTYINILIFHFIIIINIIIFIKIFITFYYNLYSLIKTLTLISELSLQSSLSIFLKIRKESII